MKFFVDLEDNKIFKAIVNLLFYGSSIVGFIFLFYKNFWILPLTFIFWCIMIIPYGILFEKKSIEHAFSDFFNIIDDPVDDIKHKLHGMKIFGITIRLPKWLMRGSGNPEK
jgi:hypothetical protein